MPLFVRAVRSAQFTSISAGRGFNAPAPSVHVSPADHVSFGSKQDDCWNSLSLHADVALYWGLRRVWRGEQTLDEAGIALIEGHNLPIVVPLFTEDDCAAAMLDARATALAVDAQEALTQYVPPIAIVRAWSFAEILGNVTPGDFWEMCSSESLSGPLASRLLALFPDECLSPWVLRSSSSDSEKGYDLDR